MEGQVAAHQRQTADGAKRCGADFLAASAHEIFKVRVHRGIECPVADEDVGFEVERQAQGIQIARADGGPFLVDQGDLAMQRSLAVFEDAHAGLEQVLIERGGGAA